ncbi:uncharacterized protein LOC127080674 [Lathyrus oleraceus]|uniref:uncharacterized protein LOC127080674 n=1 Tax=Pisum sativum TaxID=3888 RepID=UPI0021D14803|nr:uncharacterized protein LOC127080674 [Pisum sativum]
MSPNTAQDIEEERSEEEDDTLVNLVKISVAKRLRKRKSIAKIRTDRKEKRVTDISFDKRKAVKKSSNRIAAEHLDKWRFVTQRRVAVERELGKEAVEVKEVMELIKAAGLMKTQIGHASTNAVKLPIAFPSIICGIILSQQPGILSASDIPSRRKTPLSIHYKLFEGSHVNDVVMTSATREPASQGNLIDQLRETCRELENGINVAKARKEALEALIYSLEKEEIEKAGKDSEAKAQSCTNSESSDGSEDEEEGEDDTSSSCLLKNEDGETGGSDVLGDVLLLLQYGVISFLLCGSPFDACYILVS